MAFEWSASSSPLVETLYCYRSTVSCNDTSEHALIFRNNFSGGKAFCNRSDRCPHTHTLWRRLPFVFQSHLTGSRSHRIIQLSQITTAFPQSLHCKQCLVNILGVLESSGRARWYRYEVHYTVATKALARSITGYRLTRCILSYAPYPSYNHRHSSD